MFVLARALTYATLFLTLVLIVLPARVLEWSGIHAPPALGVAQLTGLAIAIAGGAITLWCVLAFAMLGQGTPAPFDPPRRLVVRGPYRFVRNPMYLGAAIALSGATIYYQSLSLVAFVALFACSATQLTDGRSAMKRIVSHLACAMAAAAVLDVGAASANEIKVFSSHAFSHAWAELKPQFEARGHKLTLVFGTSGMISKLISE